MIFWLVWGDSTFKIGVYHRRQSKRFGKSWTAISMLEPFPFFLLLGFWALRARIRPEPEANRRYLQKVGRKRILMSREKDGKFCYRITGYEFS